MTDAFDSGEVVQLTTQLVVVTLQSLSLSGQVGLQLVLAGEADAVDTLQHLAVGVATPVSAAGLGQLEAVVLDTTGVIQMRTCTQVGKFALGVEADDGIFRQILDQLYLIRLVFLLHVGNSLGTGLFAAFQTDTLLADFLHLGLDLGQMVGSEGKGSVKVVIPALVNGGADGQLNLRPQTLDGLCHDVRTGMPVGLAVFGIFKGVQIFFGHDNSLL